MTNPYLFIFSFICHTFRLRPLEAVVRTMLARPGGTANAKAVLNAQLEAVDNDTALARTLQKKY